MESDKQILLLDTCLIAGKIMAESGSEAYRVEDTMQRIASNGGEPDSVSYVTATGLFMSLKSTHCTQMEQVRVRSINLEKVDAVNQLSRKYAEKEITLPELYQQLEKVDKEAPTFPKSWQIIAAGVVSATLMVIFGGAWHDSISAFVIGATGYAVSLYGIAWLEIRFLNELGAAFIVGSLSVLAVKFGLATNIDSLIIGAVMPLVPGVAITNSFRDILAGHLLSGIARSVEAIFTAAAIGVGIALVLKFFVFGG